MVTGEAVVACDMSEPCTMGDVNVGLRAGNGTKLSHASVNRINLFGNKHTLLNNVTALT